MRLSPLLLVFALSGCLHAEDPPYGPPSGGTGGGTVVPGPDATPASGSDAGVRGVTGQLCLVEDLRDPTLCTTSISVGGIEIEELTTGETTVSDADGRFSLAAPATGSVVRLKVGFADATYHNAVVPLEVGAIDASVPVIQEATWQTILGLIGRVEPPNTASIVTSLIAADGTALVGAQVVPPAGGTPPYYDGALAANHWVLGGSTGPRGAALLLEVPTASADVTFSVSSNGSTQTVSEVPVVSGALTFVSYELQ